MDDKQVSFCISGEFLTETARNMMFEKSWTKAVKFLQEAFLEDLPLEDIISILKGELCLEGDNTMELEKEKDEVKTQLNQRWSFLLENCFVYKDKIYKPYGFVSFYDKIDHQYAVRAASGGDPLVSMNTQWYAALKDLSENKKGFNAFSEVADLEYRALFYAVNKISDIVVDVELTSVGYKSVLCEQVHLELPFWVSLNSKPLEVIKKSHEQGYLKAFYPQAYFENKNQEQTTNPDKKVEPPSFEDMDMQEDLEVSQKRNEIIAFADKDTEHGWMVFEQYFKNLGKNVKIRVPARAFICSSLSRAGASKLMPSYTPFCPSGWKCFNDNAFHTDAWIGAGFEIEDAYNEKLPEQELFMEKMYEIQRQYLQSSFDILAKGAAAFVKGEITFDPESTDDTKILVLDEARPEMTDYALKSKAVVVQTGSKLAHLVVVSREEAIPVIRISNAKDFLIEGKTLFIDFKNLTVEMI